MTRRAAPDLAEFEALSIPGQRCKTCRTIPQLDPEQQEKVEAALRAEHIGADAIARVITKWGHSISDSAIRHHRHRCLS